MRELAEELIDGLAVDETTSWTPNKLSLEPAAFHAFVEDVLVLEREGLITVIDKRKESYSGNHFWHAVMLRKLP